MAKRKIRDIIDRELIMRTNNVNYIQEFGVVGTNSNIAIINAKTIFYTNYSIHKISFVSINGVTQALGRDYTVVGISEVHFNGVVLDGRTIVVGYFYDKPVERDIKIPPRLISFSVSPTFGRGNILDFSFKIEQNDASNIYWSIYKDVALGVTAQNTAGEFLNGVDLIVDGVDSTGKVINHEISTGEAIDRADDTISFMLVVVYDLTNLPGQDEKLIRSATYKVGGVSHSVPSISISPNSVLQKATDASFDLVYRVDKGSYDLFTWEVTDPDGNVVMNAGVPATGDETDYPATDVTVSGLLHSFDYGTGNKTYKIQVIEYGSVMNKTATIINRVPQASKSTVSGYVGADKKVNILTVGGYNSSGDVYKTTITADAGVGNLTPKIATIIPQELTGYHTPLFTIFELPRSWNAAIILSSYDVTNTFDVVSNITGTTVTADIVDAYIEQSPTGESSLPIDYQIKKQA